MPVKPWVEPDTDTTQVWICNTAPQQTVTLESCFDIKKSIYDTLNGKVDTSSLDYSIYSNYQLVFQTDVRYDITATLTRTVKTDIGNGKYYTNITESTLLVGTASFPQASNSKVCPPNGFPKYNIGPTAESPQNSHEVCKMQFTPCPLGFYANAVAGSSGGPEQCVPINCPSKGTAVNNIKNLNNVIPNGASGTYCDGLCNYSIEAGGIGYQGQQFASGVSLGSQCGQSPVKGQKFTPLDKEKNCTEYNLTGADATFLDCQEGTTDEPVPDTDNPLPDVENAKVDENPVIDPFTGVECTTVDDKMSCVGGNITDAITKQTKDQAKLDAQRHNKLVEQQKDITAYVEEQQRKREDARKTDAVTMVEAIQEINRTLQTSGGSTGGGTTGGTDEGVKGAIEGLGEGINNTDVETDSTPSDGIASFYEPEYPNGFQDVWSKNKSLFDNSEMNQYLDSWKLSASGNPPIMNACFNMGFIDFGCNEFTIDPRIFPFLRIIMLVSAAFLCRALIFGG